MGQAVFGTVLNQLVAERSIALRHICYMAAIYNNNSTQKAYELFLRVRSGDIMGAGVWSIHQTNILVLMPIWSSVIGTPSLRSPEELLQQ